MDELSTKTPSEIPKCTAQLHLHKKVYYNAVLLKKVKHGQNYMLAPKHVYAYNSLKGSLAKLYGRSDFHQKCEHWRKSR